MNQRDISEIRRRLSPDKRYPTIIRGCYVGGDGHLIASFAQAVGGMPLEETEKYMSIFKRSLSGTAGQNLLPVDFTNEQVMNGEQHRLLMELCSTALKDENAVNSFYESAIAYVQTLHADQAQSVEEQQNSNNYLILLMHDAYDVPFRNINDEIDHEQSSTVFNYIIGSVCPVKQSKPSLTYFAAESEFHSRASDWVVSAPELGFMFPAYEERGANIYRAMYYTRDASDFHDAFAQSVFGAELQMTADEQKETFQTILRETLAEDCNIETVQAVHETIRGMIEEQKADKTAEPLQLTQKDVRRVLETCGVPEEKAAAFEDHYVQSFGERVEIPAVNMVTPKQFKVVTPSVSIHVDPDHSDLIETRVIDGKSYIMILADGDVEVNGLKVTLG